MFKNLPDATMVGNFGTISIIGVNIEVIILSLWLGGLIERHNRISITDRLISNLEGLDKQEQLELAIAIEICGIDKIIAINCDNNIILCGKLIDERNGDVLHENGIMRFSIENNQLPIAKVINGNVVYSISSELRTKRFNLYFLATFLFRLSSLEFFIPDSDKRVLIIASSAFVNGSVKS